ncbi:acetyl-CoA carboxylase carboxyltransferase subunit alpha [Polyangium aurulentum]|uniref:acetyl-CoA carboxylase carboxyltransferase subunit alpha n=1 Tax=Polyangium aurulentum TaxID=2567896 RepID=UPI0010AE46FF|nr:acetyl-CoA carboxylase carboxyltransferase subunit alpha [Polyangium aurulentum]UQA60953.1 acetyl-CoA carboxylase carboxyltransferase subunit alpha [Polyangium aurulentum]
MAAFVLPFEKPVVDLVERVKELRALAASDQRFEPELARLEEKTSRLVRELFANLSPIQKVQLSRHANRPYTLDYVKRLFTGFVELKGDRRFAEDPAIVGGLASYHGRSVVVVGHQKGRGTKENVKRNFGMPHPEGYRKAIRLYELADKFGLPILTFIDTPGAYPGIGAEERGQSEAIGSALSAMARVRVPIVATIIGEGGSGGALALGVANRVLVLEFGCYSVITPEGCAAILWNDGSRAEEAANQLKITAPDLLQLGVVDGIVEEPTGGAHQDHDAAARMLDATLWTTLTSLDGLSPEELVEDRYRRFRGLGAYLA